MSLQQLADCLWVQAYSRLARNGHPPQSGFVRIDHLPDQDKFLVTLNVNGAEVRRTQPGHNFTVPGSMANVMDSMVMDMLSILIAHDAMKPFLAEWDDTAYTQMLDAKADSHSLIQYQDSLFNGGGW